MIAIYILTIVLIAWATISFVVESNLKKLEKPIECLVYERCDVDIPPLKLPEGVTVISTRKRYTDIIKQNGCSDEPTNGLE